MYEILIRPKAEKFLDILSDDEFNRVYPVILGLEENPRPQGVKKLSEDIHRVRAGNFRIIYEINEDDKIVDIGKIARRSERIYKDIKKLFKKTSD